MADDRKIFAGDLGTDHLGRRVRVRVSPTLEVTDVLRAVHHEKGAAQPHPDTRVVFESVRPNNGEHNTWGGCSFGVESDSEVTVLS